MIQETGNWLDRFVGMFIYGREDAYVDQGLTYSPNPTNFHVYEIGINGDIAKPNVVAHNKLYGCRGSEFVKFIMCKIGTSTRRAVKEVERTLGSKVGYAGLKDANAFTCQFITVRCREGKVFRPEYRLLNGSVRLQFYGIDALALRRGGLEGNVFEVVLEGIKQELRDKLKNVVSEIIAAKPFPNYFGHQRFGSRRPVTHLIGKWIVYGDYAKAVEWLLGHPFPNESPRSREARKLFDEGRWEEALKTFPRSLDPEVLVMQKLLNGKSPKTSLNALGRWYINFFVEAYQSYLFNLSLSKALTDKGSVESLRRKCEVLPIPHPSLTVRGSCDTYAEEVIKDEGLDKDLPGIKYMRYGVRDSSINAVSARSYDVGEAFMLTFTLRPSAYATILLREIFRDNLKL